MVFDSSVVKIGEGVMIFRYPRVTFFSFTYNVKYEEANSGNSLLVPRFCRVLRSLMNSKNATNLCAIYAIRVTIFFRLRGESFNIFRDEASILIRARENGSGTISPKTRRIESRFVSVVLVFITTRGYREVAIDTRNIFCFTRGGDVVQDVKEAKCRASAMDLKKAGSPNHIS